LFILDKTMPNGASARYHKAVKFEVFQDATHAIVNSYHNEEMTLISWQDTYVIPILLKIETLADVETILTSPAAPFDGGVIVPDETATLDSQKARKHAEVKMTRDTKEWSGVLTPSGLIDSDPDSQRKISGAVSAAIVIGDTFSREWRMKDNSVVTLDKTDMITVGLTVMQHVSACQDKKNALDAQIDAVSTIEDLQAIDITTGWPGDPPA